MEKITRAIKFTVSERTGAVSGILTLPGKAKAIFILAHGAGAGMEHSFMETMSELLADEGIASLRFNFPYTEKKGGRPNPAPILMETVRSAINYASQIDEKLPLFAGGKSMGGRMTSMALSNEPDARVQGIVFFGFPLQPIIRFIHSFSEVLKGLSI